MSDAAPGADGVSDAAPGAAERPDVLWRMRWWMAASGVAIVLLLVVLEVDVVEQPFRGSLLLWGGVIGALAALGVWVGSTLLIRRPALVAGREEWVRRRRAVYTVTWLLTGVIAGLVAGIFDLPLLLYFYAAYVVLTAAGIGAFALVVTRRRDGAT